MTKTGGAFLSGIFYRIDLTKPDTDVILLGLAAEAHANNDGAVGLLVRKNLHPWELKKLDDIAKVQLSNLEYLIRIVQEVIEKRSRKVLDELSRKHEWALGFTTPISIEALGIKLPDDYVDGDATERVFGLLHKLLSEGPGPTMLRILPLGKEIKVTASEFRYEVLPALAA